MSDTIRNRFRSPEDFLDPAKLVTGFFLHDFVQHKAALCVVQQPEIFFGLVDRHHIHEASWIKHVGSHLSVHFDKPLHHYHFALTIRKCVLEALTKHDNEWEAFT